MQCTYTHIGACVFSHEEYGKKRETKENSLNQFRKINPKQQQKTKEMMRVLPRIDTWLHGNEDEDENRDNPKNAFENFLFNKHVSTIESKKKTRNHANFMQIFTEK